MNFCLVVIGIVLLVYCFIFFDYDIFSPPVVLTASSLVAFLLVTWHEVSWQLPMHFNTVLLITFSILSFIVGSMISHKRYIENSLSKYVLYPKIIINNKMYMVLLFIMITFLLVNIQDFYAIAHKFSNSTNLGELLRLVIEKLQFQEVKFTRWHIYREYLIVSSTYIVTGIAINYYLNGNKIDGIKYWLVVLLIYIPTILYTGGRLAYLNYLWYVTIIYYIGYGKRYGFSIKKIVPIIIAITLAGTLFIASFWGIGFLNGKINSNYTFLRVVNHYFGVNVTALDIYLNGNKLPDDQYIGKSTLSNIYSNLRFLGISVPKTNNYITDFVIVGPTTTNCYTAYRRYIQDYGIIGCMLINFILGLVYTYFYEYIKSKGGFLATTYYAAFSYPLFQQIREEMVIGWIINTGTIYSVVLMTLVYYWLTSNYGRTSNGKEV